MCDVEKNIAPRPRGTSSGTSAAVKFPRNRSRDEGVSRKRRSPLASMPRRTRRRHRTVAHPIDTTLESSSARPIAYRGWWARRTVRSRPAALRAARSGCVSHSAPRDVSRAQTVSRPSGVSRVPRRYRSFFLIVFFSGKIPPPLLPPASP